MPPREMGDLRDADAAPPRRARVGMILLRYKYYYYRLSRSGAVRAYRFRFTTYRNSFYDDRVSDLARCFMRAVMTQFHFYFDYRQDEPSR